MHENKYQRIQIQKAVHIYIITQLQNEEDRNKK